MNKNTEGPRRRFLIDALSLGLFASANVAGIIQTSLALGTVPRKLPEGRSIFRLEGWVMVDGKIANIDTKIGPNSLVITGPDSLAIFVVETDAFILRENSELQMGSSGLLIQGMRILSGKLLSVFGKREKPQIITTSTATIGIRGTGVYVESDPEKSYVCTCYGHTRISANADPDVVRDVVTEYHDKPFYIVSTGAGGNLFKSAPVINHTDVELTLIEELVGRKTPFSSSSTRY